ncbi:MAG: hypothetical protein ABR498_04250, partial [Candidatus Dormibacteria bacterium]
MSSDEQYADRLREVLRAEAEAVVPSGDGLARIRERTSRRGAVMRWLRPLAVVGGAGVIAAAVVAGISLFGDDDPSLHQNPVPLASSSETPTSSPSAQVLPVPKSLTLPVGLPLWPFADGAAAAQGASTATDSPPSVALHFTRDFLGFTDNDLALSTEMSSDGQQAWVNVGYHTEGSRTGTAAAVHLVRWSNNGPWEVVGTRDTTLSLTKPSYGATATSPITAGGSISGVDESIRVAVQQSSSNQPLGVGCCVPAGTGPWSEKVAYKSSSASVLTIVASTGGHLIEHERWALTAVRNPTRASSAPTFVAKASDRIGVFRSTDGGRVRWLTSADATINNPQHVGTYVYFVRGNCPSKLVRVPYLGGAEMVVYAPAGSGIGNYGVSADGKIAVDVTRCSDQQHRLYALDPSTGHSHATAYTSSPPMFTGNLAWAPDNKHIAAVVRTGNLASVRLIDPFTASKVDSGSTVCG